MTDRKNDQAISLTVTDGLTVTILPDSSHEFLIPTKDVAAGYGINPSTLRSHLHRYGDEFTEGVHFLVAVAISNGDTRGGYTRTNVWTKAGVIRLGFFIKSERAKLFRDWAEGLILAVVGQKQPTLLPAATKRKHNRLTAERIIDILTDVCRIEDRELRERIALKITGGQPNVN